MLQRWVMTALAAGVLILGWYGWSGSSRAAQQRTLLEKAAWSQLMSANSAIFDANWALQQVQDPAATESAPLIREATQGLIVAREQLNALRQEVFWETIPFEDVHELADRVHVLAVGLQYALQSGELDRVYGDRNYLRVMTANLPFPNQRRDVAAYREAIAEIRAIGQAEGFSLRRVPTAPPVMQLVVGGSHWPVKQGGYCWKELGNAHCVDMAGPAELAAETTTYEVKPGTRVELRFAWAPDPGTVKVWQVSGGTQVPVALGSDWSFALPAQVGEYVYWAEARWAQGNGTYAFRAKVR